MLSLHCRLLMKVVAMPVLPLRPCTRHRQDTQHGSQCTSHILLLQQWYYL
jgi:hypothetical protein